MASDQIRQMVNFILQEAHEKANEIRVKVRKIFWFIGGWKNVCDYILLQRGDNTTGLFCLQYYIIIWRYLRQGKGVEVNDVLLVC